MDFDVLKDISQRKTEFMYGNECKSSIELEEIDLTGIMRRLK